MTNTELLPQSDQEFDGYDASGDWDTFNDFGDSEETPEHRQAREANELASYYIDPVGSAKAHEIDGMEPVDESALQTWLAGLSYEDRQRLEETRQAVQEGREHMAAVHAKLEATVPELYDARLPRELEERLDGSQYALGFNQSMDVAAQEAARHLGEFRGVDMAGYNNHHVHRFLMADQATASTEDGREGVVEAVDGGYYRNSRIGRYVVAFPVAEVQPGESLATTASDNHDVLPDDFHVTWDRPDGFAGKSVSAKYVAGFIDGEGQFWENQGFARDDTADLQPYNPDFV
jgi:hypothetical protein